MVGWRGRGRFFFPWSKSGVVYSVFMNMTKNSSRTLVVLDALDWNGSRCNHLAHSVSLSKQFALSFSYIYHAMFGQYGHSPEPPCTSAQVGVGAYGTSSCPAGTSSSRCIDGCAPGGAKCTHYISILKLKREREGFLARGRKNSGIWLRVIDLLLSTLRRVALRERWHEFPHLC